MGGITSASIPCHLTLAYYACRLTYCHSFAKIWSSQEGEGEHALGYEDDEDEERPGGRSVVDDLARVGEVIERFPCDDAHRVAELQKDPVCHHGGQYRCGGGSQDGDGHLKRDKIAPSTHLTLSQSQAVMRALTPRADFQRGLGWMARSDSHW